MKTEFAKCSYYACSLLIFILGLLVDLLLDLLLDLLVLLGYQVCLQAQPTLEEHHEVSAGQRPHETQLCSPWVF